MTLVIILVLFLNITGMWTHVNDKFKQYVTKSVISIPRPIVKLPPPPPVPAFPLSPLQLDPSSSAYAIDTQTGQILFQQNADKPRPIASVTKLMTVMVALDKLEPTDVVTVGKLPDYAIADETAGLRNGEKFQVLDLVKATLIASDNDAADALGIAVSGNLPAFYTAMNAKAAEWGIDGAHFTSASGLVDEGNLVSASSIAKIAALDLSSQVVRSIIATQSSTIRDSAGVTYNLKTTNDLLATGHFYGIKTGYTEAAGQCFVGLTKFDGHEVITVVLGSSDRFGETQTLVNWIGQNWTWQQ